MPEAEQRIAPHIVRLRGRVTPPCIRGGKPPPGTTMMGAFIFWNLSTAPQHPGRCPFSFGLALDSADSARHAEPPRRFPSPWRAAFAAHPLPVDQRTESCRTPPNRSSAPIVLTAPKRAPAPVVTQWGSRDLLQSWGQFDFGGRGRPQSVRGSLRHGWIGAEVVTGDDKLINVETGMQVKVVRIPLSAMWSD
jgi:hypothetical protein